MFAAISKERQGACRKKKSEGVTPLQRFAIWEIRNCKGLAKK